METTVGRGSGLLLSDALPEEDLVVGSHVEVLQQDPGVEGVWFCARLLHVDDVSALVSYCGTHHLSGLQPAGIHIRAGSLPRGQCWVSMKVVRPSPPSDADWRASMRANLAHLKPGQLRSVPGVGGLGGVFPADAASLRMEVAADGGWWAASLVRGLVRLRSETSK